MNLVNYKSFKVLPYIRLLRIQMMFYPNYMSTNMLVLTLLLTVLFSYALSSFLSLFDQHAIELIISSMFIDLRASFLALLTILIGYALVCSTTLSAALSKTLIKRINREET